MKNLFVMILMAGLLLTGCAKNAAMDDQASNDVAPAAAPVVVDEPTEPVEIAASAEPEPQIEIAADKIFFDFDSYVLSSANKAILQENALWLKAQPELRVIIEGHTDERGSSSYNLALGENRAKAVRAFLLNVGIDSGRISIVSYGQEKATQGAGNEAVWALDRRAEFVLAN